MDLNTILTWTVGASCGLLLLRMLLNPRRPPGWMAISAGLLALVTLLRWWAPDQAGLISGPLWALLVLGPILVSRALSLAVLHRQWNRAAIMARLLATLHPLDGMQNQPRVVRVLSSIDRGLEDDVADELAQLRRDDSPLSWTAIARQAEVRGAWAEMLAWVDRHPKREGLLKHPPLVAAVLRALGELGRTADMVDHYRTHGETRAMRQDTMRQGLMVAQLGAFLGRDDLVEAMLDGPLGALGSSASEFWMGTAAQVAGQGEKAEKHFQVARVQARDSQLKEIERRLQQPLDTLPPEALSPEQHRWLEELASRSRHERHFASLSSGARHKTPATWALCALLAAVFAIEMQGGADNIENLVKLGALIVPVELTPDEGWRRLSAGFLHFGAIHLAMNLAALMLLGRWLERSVGSVRMVACYLVSTLASIGLFPLFAMATLDQPQIVVGASGGVMGLLGALLGIVLVGRTQGPSKLVASQLNLLLLLVVMQVVFDDQTPMVSSLAHTLGLVTGLLFGMGLGAALVGRVRSETEPPGSNS